MPQTMMLTGDVNLMNVTEPEVPFRLVAPALKQADFVFSNLECCFYEPPGARALENAIITDRSCISERVKQDLDLIIGKYL